MSGYKGTNASGGNLSGEVQIWKNNSGTWEQLGDEISGAVSNSYSGASLALSGDGSVVGIHSWQNNTIRTYQYINGEWENIGLFGGNSVDISDDGSIVAVGGSSSTRVFRYTESATSPAANTPGLLVEVTSPIKPLLI